MIINKKNEIINCLNTMCNIKDENKQTEFEVRFGQFIKDKYISVIKLEEYIKKYKVIKNIDQIIKDKYVPIINLEEFINIYTYMNTIKKTNTIEYSLIVEHKNGIRVTQILDNPKKGEIFSYPWKGNQIKGEKIILKTNIRNIDENQLGVRFSLSEEETVKDVSSIHDPKNPGVFFKIRKRISYIMDNIKIEISFFKESETLNMLDEQECKYDVEIEVIKNTKDTYNEMTYMIEQILKIIQKSSIVMTSNEILNIKDVYFYLTKNKYFVGCQPETLREEKLLKEDYAMTLKLDGKRHLLLIANNKCYLINNKINIFNMGMNIIPGYNSTLIDGELFNGKFYCFDILYENGRDIRKETFIKRHSTLKNIVKILKTDFIILKEYIFGDIYENIKKHVTDDNKLKEPENIDGIIIVPINREYPITKNENVPLKWKPELLNTIDFKIKKIKQEGNKEIEEWQLLCSIDNNCDIPFSYDNNYNLGKIRLSTKIAENYMDNTVIEFYYDKNKQQFFPYKTRYDKSKGNHITVGQDNFETILNPFNFEILNKTIITNTRYEPPFKNMRRFHNWIKRYILNKYSTKHGNLLDLSCGKGGDIHKWVDNSIRYVEGYDINEKSIKEALNRYNKVKDNPTCKNFDYEFYIKDLSKEVIKTDNKFDIITCFFAIHYFYNNIEALENFTENLKYVKDNGYIVITTLSSKKLNEIDYTYKSENLNIKKINIDSSTKLGNNISVYIKDTVLDTETEEFIVDYEYTINFMKTKGFDLVSTKTFNEYYNKWKENKNELSDEEQKYSFLNMSYTFVKSNKPDIKSDITTKVNVDKSWTVKELKNYCKEHNISITGKKEQLIERIKKL